MNYKTRHCLEYPCTSSLPENIEVRNSRGDVLNSWAQGLYDNQHRACSTSADCQWMVWTAAQALCKEYPCIPSTLGLIASLSWDPSWKLKNSDMPRSQFIYLRIPRDLFLKQQSWQGKNCLDRNPPHSFLGLSVDGEPLCVLDSVAQDLQKVKDLNPYKEQTRPDLPMTGFEVGSFPYVPNTSLQAKNLLAQIKIWSLSGQAIYETLKQSNCFGASGCAQGTRLNLFLAEQEPLADRDGKMTDVLMPCQVAKTCPWQVKISLLSECRKEACDKVDQKVKVEIFKDHTLLEQSLLPLAPPLKPRSPRAACKGKEAFRGFNEKGEPLCGKQGD
ncbi:hypothetical protein [Bdellovibrio sp.]|uniref:hypothetical protein n=1 Tax=Bdellovibrio sp. TaxID=28201 RepID=UPI0039E322B3